MGIERERERERLGGSEIQLTELGMEKAENGKTLD